jgi:hypothetical protein
VTGAGNSLQMLAADLWAWSRWQERQHSDQHAQLNMQTWSLHHNTSCKEIDGAIADWFQLP